MLRLHPLISITVVLFSFLKLLVVYPCRLPTVRRVAKYLACLPGVDLQLCHIAEGLNFSLTVTSSSFNQINNIKRVSSVQPIIRVSMNLPTFVAWSPTSSHCSHVFGSGSIPIARQSAYHKANPFPSADDY
jgi:hypothetical protein